MIIISLYCVNAFANKEKIFTMLTNEVITEKQIEKICAYATIFHHNGAYSECFKIYEKLLELQGTNFFMTNYFEEVNLMFLYYDVAIRRHWFQRPLTNSIEIARQYGIIGRKIGYEYFAKAKNPERFAAFLHIFGIVEEQYQAGLSREERDFQKAIDIFDEATSVYPYFSGEMLNIWRRKQAFNSPTESPKIAWLIATNAPFANTLFYRNGGWASTVKGNYREAFQLWFKGLEDGEPVFFNSPTPERPLEYIEYATEEEIIELKRLYGVNVTKFPMIDQNMFQISGWLKFYNDTKLLDDELKLRTLDKYSEEYTNQLKHMFTQYRKPYYAIQYGGYSEVINYYFVVLTDESLTSLHDPIGASAQIEKYIEKTDKDLYRKYIDIIKSKYASLETDAHWSKSPDKARTKSIYEKKINELEDKYNAFLENK